MGHFFQNLHFDRASFFIGFFTGILFWWLLTRARPWLSIGFHKLLELIRSTRESLSASTDVRLRNDVIRAAQKMQMASPLFSLDEIVVQPRLQAPPPPVQPGIIPMAEDIVATTLPFLPDGPELAATYKAPTFTLAEALRGNANLILIGHHGSGKTVALAHLATQIARLEPLPGNLKSYFPLLVHAADITLPPRNPEDLLETIKDAIAHYASALTQSRLSEFLTKIFTNGQVLVLLDGLDVLPPDKYSLTIEYLRNILQQYPQIRCVATATPDFFDGLTDLGFIPVPMAIWEENQKADFLAKWSQLWRKFVSQQGGEDEAVNSVLLNSWLLSDKTALSPFEFSLRVWSAYAGDVLGPSLLNSIDAYLRRMSTGIKNGRPAMEKIALQALVTRTPYFTQKDAQGWVAEFESIPETSIQTETEQSAPAELPVDGQKTKETVHVSRLVSALLDSGVLLPHGENRLGFSHPLILSYLAGCALRAKTYTDEILDLINWAMVVNAIGFNAAQSTESILVTHIIDHSSEPLNREIIQIGRWLPHTLDHASWRTQLMRSLAGILQNTSQPLALRARALNDLAVAGGVGVDVLFHQLIASDDPWQRVLGALGCGQIRDAKAVEDLNSLIKDLNPDVSHAAVLALVAIGNRQALEYVADALLSGDDDLRRSAAQAIANNPEEGYPVLKEAATLDDLLVRKASIPGLQRVREPWSLQLIEDLHLKDEQWVVKDAAAQAIKEIALPNPRIPQPLPPLVNTPWLIAFAGEQGIGVAPGKAAWELLMKALREGNEEQRLAALYFLSIHDYSAAILPIYQIFYQSEGEIREAAYNTLLNMASAGVELPMPVQFGLGLST